MTQYKVSWDCQTIDGVQHMEEIDKDFGAASYHALSLRNRGYQNVKVEVVHTGVKKSERQYVALLKLFGPNRVFRVVLVGKPGEAAEVVGSQADVENSDWGFIKVVTLSVAKRSYKRAWRAWEESQRKREEISFEYHGMCQFHGCLRPATHGVLDARYCTDHATSPMAYVL